MLSLHSKSDIKPASAVACTLNAKRLRQRLRAAHSLTTASGSCRRYISTLSGMRGVWRCVACIRQMPGSSGGLHAVMRTSHTVADACVELMIATCVERAGGCSGCE